MNNSVALALCIPLIAWAWLMRSLAGTWLQPAAFFALWWCFAGILPLILAPGEPVGPHAILWLIAASMAVSAGAIAGNFGIRTRLATLPAAATDRELLMLGAVVSVSVILGMISNIVFAIGSNVALGDLLDIQKLVIVSNQLYVQRYDEIPPAAPLLSQALLPFVFLAPALGGILFVLRREARWKAVALSAFLPAIAVTVLQTTKAAVLFALVFWMSGYFAARLRFRKIAAFTKPHLLIAVVMGGVMAVFFFAVSLARMASTDAGLLDLVTRKLFTAAFGHMTVFSQWLQQYWNAPSNPSLGTVVFAGPLEMLGYGHRIPGVFENVVDLIVGETSNVYTGFRPIIEDFTIPGALVILTALGFIGGTGFRLVAGGKWSGVPLLLIAYYTIMLSPITWFWIYNSLTATVFAVFILIAAIKLLRGKTLNGSVAMQEGPIPDSGGST